MLVILFAHTPYDDPGCGIIDPTAWVMVGVVVGMATLARWVTARGGASKEHLKQRTPENGWVHNQLYSRGNDSGLIYTLLLENICDRPSVILRE